MVAGQGMPRHAFPASASSDAASLGRSQPRVRSESATEPYWLVAVVDALARGRSTLLHLARTKHSHGRSERHDSSDREGTGDLQEQLEDLIERPGVTLRIGPTDSGLGIFPDTLKDDDQIIEHDGRAVLLIDQEVSETLADTTIDVEERADGAHFVVRR